MSTEFSLIFFDVVESFNSVVSKVAGIFFVAFLSITEFAKVGRVCTATTSLVDERVIVGTVLVIVLALDVAFVNLEDLEVEVLYGARLTTFLRNSLEFVK